VEAQRANGVRMAQHASGFQLIPQPHATVTFTLPGAGAPRTLVRVTVANLDNGTAGDQMRMTENCDVAVMNVTGAVGSMVPVFGQPVFLGTTPAQALFAEYFAAIRLTGGHPTGTDIPTAAPAMQVAQDQIAQNYGTSIWLGAGERRRAGAQPWAGRRIADARRKPIGCGSFEVTRWLL